MKGDGKGRSGGYGKAENMEDNEGKQKKWNWKGRRNRNCGE